MIFIIYNNKMYTQLTILNYSQLAFKLKYNKKPMIDALDNNFTSKLYYKTAMIHSDF